MVPTPDESQDGGQQEATILVEIRKLRQEHMEAANDIKTLLGRLETNIKDFLEMIALLEQQITNMEESLSDMEDTTARLEDQSPFCYANTLNYAKTSRSRHSNTRIFGDLDSLGKNDIVGFVTDLIHSSLQLRDDLEIHSERVHLLLNAKSKDNTAPLRVIIVCFLDDSIE